MAGVKNQVKDLLKNKSNKLLLESLQMLDQAVQNESDKSKAADYRVARAWVCDELESRLPEINKAIEDWVLSIHDDGRSYFDVVAEVVSESLSKSK